MVESKSISSLNSTEILSTAQKRNGFHVKYLAVCKSKNLMPLPEVKAKQRNIHLLDFHADRVRPYDWIAICNSLYNDKTLKSLAIRLRKNSEFVQEQLDTLKKAQTLVNVPVIYSKFLFNELIKALQNLILSSNILENLVLEGLPLSGRYMITFANGLTKNQNIKSLSFARCNMGDEACDTLCETLKHLMNVETLNLSCCSLSVKGIESVTTLVKFHKIQRFSEAWSQSLRYRDVNSDSFPGLRKLLLNNNPEIGDKGVEVLAEALKEDVFVKDIEMQNCGLTDEGVQHIINCLNINQTVMNFNIAGNTEVSERLHRHIVGHFGQADTDSSDSSDSNTPMEKLSKFKLLDKLKFLEDQLEMEYFRRNKMEELNEKLQEQIFDMQKEAACQESFNVPEGFQLVADTTMKKLLNENSELAVTPSSRSLKQRRKRRTLNPKKVVSYTASRPPTARFEYGSKSETLMKPIVEDQKKIFIERNIGDHNNYQSDDSTMTSTELLRMFSRQKKRNQQGIQNGTGDHFRAELPVDDPGILDVFAGQTHESYERAVTTESHSGFETEVTLKGSPPSTPINMFSKREPPQLKADILPMTFDPRSLFNNSSKRVPENSDAESND